MGLRRKSTAVVQPCRGNEIAAGLGDRRRSNLCIV